MLLATQSLDHCLWGGGWSPIIPILVYQLAYPSICPQIQGSQCGAYAGAVEDMMCVVCVDVTEGHSNDGCVLASTLCKGEVVVLNWTRVRRVMRGSNSSELIMCGGGVRSILLLPLVDICSETIDVCIWRMFVLCLL